GRAAVRNTGRVRLRNFHAIDRDTQCISRDLGENGVGTLPNLSAGRKHLQLPRRCCFHAYNRGQLLLAGTSELGSVHERGKPDAFLDAGGPIVFCKFTLSLVVTALLEGIVQQPTQINPLPHHLAGGRCRSLLQKISAPKFLWSETYAR